MSDPDRHPIDVVAEDFARRCRAGERPSVSEYALKYPDLAGELRDVLPSIAMMEKLKNNRKSQAGVASVPRIEQLGDFRIVRELGRGGMGVVYEAVQESLGRHVALKVLSSSATMDPTRLQRFEQEARAAARLHHTNIVPVFGVGEQNGLHYYVMQYIEGQTVAQAVKSLAMKHTARKKRGKTASDSTTPAKAIQAEAGSTIADPATIDLDSSSTDIRFARHYWRWCARIGFQVAQALQYAHQQGTLHRDVKPANLILDPLGSVWVTDFGLAKIGESSDVTRTGDIVGTLQYMAPEAFKKTADARSDVYGLGLTLYEMLTLRPPYGDGHPAELIRQISTTDPPRARTVNKAIPQDLETIVMKAIARDPAHRYSTAGEMAKDLESFLQDRPIRARRVSAVERTWRWCRRNRAVAALAAVALLATIAALVVGWVGYTNTSLALFQESQRRRQAEEATKRAQENVQLSLAAFEDIFNQVSQQEYQSPPPKGAPPIRAPRQGSTSVDANVLQSVLSFYDHFAQQNATDANLHAEAARSYFRVGDLYRWLGEEAKADAAYERSASMYEELLSRAPSQREYARGLVEAAGVAANQAQANSVLEKRIRKALETLEPANAPDDPKDAGTIAKAYVALAKNAEAGKDLVLAERMYRQALDLYSHRIPGNRDHPPQGPPPYLEPVGAVLGLSKILMDQGKLEPARDLLKRAIDDVEGHTPPPGQGRSANADPLAHLYETLSAVFAKLKDPTSAEAAMRKANRVHNGSPPRDRP